MSRRRPRGKDGTLAARDQLSLSCWRTVLVGTICSSTLFLTGDGQCLAQDFSLVPGTVVDHLPKSGGEYVGSPSIAALADGSLVASHDRFGPGSTAGTSAKTDIFRSTDGGETWSQTVQLNGQYWSGLFTHDDDLYIMGVDKSYGKIVIRQSSDGGLNWTTPTSTANGFLTTANGYHSAPMPIVEHNGRLWRGFEDNGDGGGWPNHFRSFVMSAPVGSDLLDASSWTYSNALSKDTDWLDGQMRGWLEGGVVVNRDDELINMLRVHNQSVAAQVTVDESSHTIDFDPDGGFINFPGGPVRFTIRYDEQSDKYWTLSNPILPQHVGNPPSATRNAMALMSSSDLSSWDVESVLIYHPDTVKHGFQYTDWQFDGDDLIAASRTAYDDGLGGANNYHDANFLTFHRFDDFRSLDPSHALVADTNNDRVLRYQANLSGDWIPLGEFVTGDLPGGTLQKPMGITQDEDGFVYVGEQIDGGRILRFDAGGNFINVVATEGIDFSGRPEALTLDPDGNLLLSVAFGTDSDRILRIDLADSSVGTLVNTNFTGGALINPRGIAVDDGGILHVANRDGDNILQFDSQSGTFLGSLWNVDRPQGLTWDADSMQLLATAQLNTELYEVDAAGNATKLYDPSDIGSGLGIETIDGEIFWSDYSNGEIYRLTGVDQKETVVSGLSGPGHLVAVAAPNERTWQVDDSGLWRNPLNWHAYWGSPNTSDEIAVFGPGFSQSRSIVLDADETIGGLRLLGDHSIVIRGTGRLILDGDRLEAFSGDHQVHVEVQLAADIQAYIASSASLALNNRLLLDGNTLVKTGGGELAINDDVIADGGSVVLVDGTISGSGNIGGSLSNVSGVVSPGNSPGALTVMGSYVQSASATLVAEIDGTVPGIEYDQLIVAGTAILAGTLEVVIDPLFTPQPGDSFSVLTYGSRVGYFDMITGLDFAGMRLAPLYGATDLRLAVLAPGDGNGDGHIDGLDYLLWAAAFGDDPAADPPGSPTNGDFNNDGKVDGADYLLWAGNYGQGPNDGVAVPEPGSGILAMVACVGLLAMTGSIRPGRSRRCL